VWKLKCLKLEIKRWSGNFKKRLSQKLDELEEELQSLYQVSLADLKNMGIYDRIKTKEGERHLLLKAEEDSWRQKSRAIWLNCGDHNSNCFHHYASDQKNRKQIWELLSELS